MTYAGIQMFMEKLNQLINCYDIPFINNPSIIIQRPQFQLLYEELGSIIQTLSTQERQDLEKLNDLKQRFTNAAEEAQYIVDVFLFYVHLRNIGRFQTYEDFKRAQHRDDVRRSFKFKSFVDMFLSWVHIRNKEHFPASEDFTPSLNLDEVRRSLKSIKLEFMSMNIDSKKTDSSTSPQRTLNQSAVAPISITRNSLQSNKSIDEILVGLDRDFGLIRDKLVEDKKKVDVVSIVGMAGIGKTTLATRVFNDGYVKHHFHFRVWVTVSQTYDKRAVLTQILESIHAQLNLKKNTDSTLHKEAKQKHKKNTDSPLYEEANDYRLRELVHKNLTGKKYLIVIDDIWDIETWDNLKVFFPHDNNGSRILLTSRHTIVAKHANSDGLIHHLGYLNKERSWELLYQKVFQGNECPEWSIKPGMQIVENCQGLPLALVVIAGVLAKETWSEVFWAEIAEKTGSYIVRDQNRCLETLGLSYSHLPLHLRECFVYLGGFPEDYEFKVQRLIWLWVAEGFIQQDGNRSLEDIAEGYLMDLIDRNLVIVTHRKKYDGAVKACKVHDLVRELCLIKAKEERFILITMLSPQISDVVTQPYKPVRIFINEHVTNPNYLSTQNIRAILCYPDNIFSSNVANFGCSFVLLRVLDLQKCGLSDLPEGMELLIHLRYLAIYKYTKGFPFSICNLWNLQTLIYITSEDWTVLPSNISDLVNLRHLWTFSSRYGGKTFFVLPSIEQPMNLQTISDVELGVGVDNLRKCFPYIKELTCTTYKRMQNDFKSLTYLEKLNLINLYRGVDHFTLPATLKSLRLEGCGLPWSDMSIIQSLPNLQILKLRRNAFEGSCWNTDGQEFPLLKFLRIDWLDMEVWEAYSTSFPCLRRLEIFHCYHLKEIPLEIGDIPTLELIQIKYCSDSVGDSVRSIEKEQHDFGNFDLKIHIWK